MLTHVSYSKNVSAQLCLYSLAVSNVYQSCDVIIGLVVKITFDCGTYLSGKYIHFCSICVGHKTADLLGGLALCKIFLDLLLAIMPL